MDNETMQQVDEIKNRLDSISDELFSITDNIGEDNENSRNIGMALHYVDRAYKLLSEV